MLLEVLLAGGGELDGNELEAAVLEAGDDGANQATLDMSVVVFKRWEQGKLTWTPSGLIAMKL